MPRNGGPQDLAADMFPARSAASVRQSVQPSAIGFHRYLGHLRCAGSISGYAECGSI